ncbi:MAG: hypothetical protein WAT71_04125 [Ignavibacteria bacterium]
MKQLVLIVSLALLSFICLTHPDETDYNYTNQNNTKLYCPVYIPDTQTINEIISNNQNGNYNVERDWNSIVQSNITQEEFNITQSNKFNIFQSQIRKNIIGISNNKDGYTAISRIVNSENDPEYPETKVTVKSEINMNQWKIDLRLKTSGYLLNGSEINISYNMAHIENNKIRIIYKKPVEKFNGV